MLNVLNFTRFALSNIHAFSSDVIVCKLVFPLASFSMAPHHHPCPFTLAPCPFHQCHAPFLQLHKMPYILVKRNRKNLMKTKKVTDFSV